MPEDYVGCAWSWGVTIHTWAAKFRRCDHPAWSGAFLSSPPASSPSGQSSGCPYMCMSNVDAKWDFAEILIDSWALPFCTTAITSSGPCLWECISPWQRSGAWVLSALNVTFLLLPNTGWVSGSAAQPCVCTPGCLPAHCDLALKRIHDSGKHFCLGSPLFLSGSSCS